MKERILDSLKVLHVPGEERNIVDMDRVSDICIVQNKAYLSITVSHNVAHQLQSLRIEAERIIKNIPEISDAIVTLTESKKAQKQTYSPLHNIGAFVAVASGKGGVGKSTTTVNLACALNRQGKKIAILDADVYGPSIPKLLRLSGKAEMVDKKYLKPMENYGIKIMSIGSLVEEDVAMIWRGPMIQSALMQMLHNVSWGKFEFNFSFKK
ncbi:MAG: MRP family ATP-binding protein [Candidatus Liberibacter ctenarytainae]|uniref:MRP family ATP-binding protein n=1 Tax=Candidatus Liberibacter ctenarytainae TaxID=2020335 RepID=A0A937AC33_9HYPH|nr:MRP family ATP-binding protein [Candidatus Liberibacter ctenarytainae]